MLVKTKYFGEIELSDEKIIEFPQGIMGFEQYKRYTILYDVEDSDFSISWLQSVEEESLALPVVNPLMVKPDYNPTVEDEVLKPLGDINEENLVLLLSLTGDKDVKKTTVNLKAPFVINADTRTGCQIITENPDYPIKYNIYETIEQLKKSKRGETQC